VTSTLARDRQTRPDRCGQIASTPCSCPFPWDRPSSFLAPRWSITLCSGPWAGSGQWAESEAARPCSLGSALTITFRGLNRSDTAAEVEERPCTGRIHHPQAAVRAQRGFGVGIGVFQAVGGITSWNTSPAGGCGPGRLHGRFVAALTCGLLVGGQRWVARRSQGRV